MSTRPTIRPYIQARPLTFTPKLPVVEAVARFLERGVSGAPVVDEAGQLCGIVTAKDCFRAALCASYYQGGREIIADFMTREVQTMEADLDLVTAAERFLANDFRHFPVMDEGRLVGLFERLDLLRALNAHWASL